MKIAIHDRPGSFSDGWIRYCTERQIPHKLVNCYDSDIINQLNDCDGLMWHWDQNDYKAPLFARQLTLSLEKKGIKVFPDTDTVWHFDDKLGQSYLLEAVGAPLIKSHVFYSKKDALRWLEKTTFPKVFKLRGGASGVNVKLVKTKQQAHRLIQKAFGRGFSHINRWTRLKDRIWKFKSHKDLSTFKGIVSGVARLVIPTEVEKYSSNEKGYVFFQDFLPNNTYDTRLIVIGNRCFGTRRYCRTNDFRASGSGLYDNAPDIFDQSSIRAAFDTAQKLNTHSIAFDFIWDNKKPRICEISYIFCRDITENCNGYWDQNLVWHETKVNAEYFMIEDFIGKLVHSECVK